MQRSRRNSYRSSIVPMLMIGGTAVGLLGLAGVWIAWSVGAFDTEGRRVVDRSGQLAFPSLARPVAAFEAISREHLINPSTGQLNVIWLPESTAEVASRSVGDLLGRVLRRDKGANSVLTERDFLPAGTKPGFSAGIPPGKFAVTIPTAGIPGLEQLRHGDRFDLMVAFSGIDAGAPTNRRSAGDRPATGNASESSIEESRTEPAVVFGGIKPPSLRVGQVSQRHGVKRLVAGGQLITLARGSQRSIRGREGLTITPTPSRSSSESETFAEIAIGEEEVGPLTEAISLDAPLTCVVRSGRPEAEVGESFSREGLVPVITTATDVEAYTAVTDAALIDAATGQLHYYYFPPDRVPDHWLTEPTAVYGRVVARSLRRGSPIAESDLLPVGATPGISAGVPAGMVAIAVNTDQLAGFADLTQGDCFAIHAKIPASAAKSIDTSWVRVQGGSLSPEARRFEQMLRSGIREVLPKAIFLRGGADATATIAIPDDRIAEVAQLIRDKSELFVVAKSSDDVGPAAVKQRPVEQRPADDSRLLDRSSGGEATRTLVTTQQDDRVTEAEQTRVPILTRQVDAFQPLSVEDFIDPSTGQVRYVFFPADRVRAEWQTEVSDLIDRVTLRSLLAGRAVASTDLAPPGSPSGPSAGVPAGRVGLIVDSSQLVDLDLLGPGSHFDLVSADVFRPADLGDQVRRTLASPDAVAEAQKLAGAGFPISQTVASDVLLLASLGVVERTSRERLTDRTTTTRTTATTTRATATGGLEEVTTTERPRIEVRRSEVRRFAIAVRREDAASLSSFLRRDRSLRVVLAESRTASPSAIQPGTGDSSPPIKTFIREHFHGDEDPFTEVFVSDQALAGIETVSPGSPGPPAAVRHAP